MLPPDLEDEEFISGADLDMPKFDEEPKFDDLDGGGPRGMFEED